VVIEGGLASETERFEARLVRYDGVPVRRVHREIEVLPGEHAFDVAWSLSRVLPGKERAWVPVDSGSLQMAFELRPGFRYVLFWTGGEQPLRFRELPLAVK